MHTFSQKVATISRRLKIKGLFCRIWSLLWGSFAKLTHNFPMHPATLQGTSELVMRGVEGLIIMGHFPQKSPVISGSFAERNLQLGAASYVSLPPCRM